MNILIIAGENSGDIHAAAILPAISSKIPEAKFWGTGGHRLEKSGLELIETIDNLACIGLFAPLLKIFFFIKLKNNLIKKAKQNNTKLAILVDFGGFNLKIAKELKSSKIPVLYFITPKFWAWGGSRLNGIKKYVEHAAVILPFEAELLKKSGVAATYVGNPLMMQIPKTKTKTQASLTIGLMPGSRISEIKRHLNLFIESAKIVQESIAINIVLSKAGNLPELLFQDVPKEIKIYSDHHAMINDCDVIIVASGTATLEVALMKKPMVIVYKTDLITELFFKLFANTKHIGLPNIILEQRLVPELTQSNAKPITIANELIQVIKDPNRQISGLEKISEKLDFHKPYNEEVAKIAITILNKKAHTGES